jgi:hypothetical protein
MNIQSLARPTARLLATSRSSLPLTSTRGHKTTRRTKRALKIAPHDDFLPSRAAGATYPAGDSIIYNPPSSEASPFHTPFLFLPTGDPRRAALERLRATNPAALSAAAAAPASPDELPGAMRYPRRETKYNLTSADFDEMRRLREEDPLKWSVNALSRHFACSPIIVQIAAPASADHLKWLREKLERKKARWGPIKTQARDDRKRRAEMLYRGEICTGVVPGTTCLRRIGASKPLYKTHNF